MNYPEVTNNIFRGKVEDKAKNFNLQMIKSWMIGICSTYTRCLASGPEGEETKLTHFSPMSHFCTG